MKGDQERCLAAGMDRYVSKPVTASDLFSALQEIIPTTPAVAKPAETAPEGHVAIDRKAVCEHVGSDEDILREITTIFIEDYPGHVARIRQAIKRRDAEALERSAHTLKGSVSNFAAPAAFQAAFSLESLGRSRDFRQAQEGLDRLEKELERVRAALEALAKDPAPCSGDGSEQRL
jgi:HPt (histidine-containing phosphotransfer) domain-containing protein